MEFAIQINLEYNLIVVWNLAQSWSISRKAKNDTEYQFSKVLEHSLKQLYGMKIIS